MANTDRFIPLGEPDPFDDPVECRADQESEPKDPELRVKVRRFRAEVERELEFLEDLLRRVEAGEFDDEFPVK